MGSSLVGFKFAVQAAILIFGCTVVFSQSPPGQQPSPPPKETAPPPQTAPATPLPAASTPENNQPNTDDQRRRSMTPTGPRSAPVTGVVVVAGGRPLPDEAMVQAVCSGRPGQVVYTRSRFRVMIGQTYHTGGGQAPDGMDLASCEIRASLPGFLPATTAVQNPSPYGSDVGVIVLHPRNDVSGFTYSYSSLTAPKEAQKAFEKGLQRARKEKLAAAQRELENAVGIHPSYASAWFELGVVYHKQNRIEDARKAYAQAAKADDKFVKPLLQLAMMSAGERKWEETSRLTSQVIAMNRFEFPQAFLYNAVANYNLKHVQEAEKAVLRAIELDARHQFPRAFYLLGTIQAERNDPNAAMDSLRAYLKFAPRAGDADQVRKRIAELEALRWDDNGH